MRQRETKGLYFGVAEGRRIDEEELKGGARVFFFFWREAENFFLL